MSREANFEIPVGPAGHSQYLNIKVDTSTGRVWVYGDFKEVTAVCNVNVEGNGATLPSAHSLEGDQVRVVVERGMGHDDITASVLRTDDPLTFGTEPRIRATVVRRDLPSLPQGFHVTASCGLETIHSLFRGQLEPMREPTT